MNTFYCNKNLKKKSVKIKFNNMIKILTRNDFLTQNFNLTFNSPFKFKISYLLVF